MTETAAEKFKARWDLAAYKARCAIQGTVKNDKTKSIEPKSGAWSEEFASHPTVQLAEAEGWSKELRSAVFPVVRKRMMDGLPCAIINDFMPSEKWIKDTRERVAIEREAWIWQQQQPERIVPKGSTFKAMTTVAPFSGMQHESRNQYLHRAPLTERSRRMMGDE